jgi:hypothetical protein
MLTDKRPRNAGKMRIINGIEVVAVVALKATKG